MTRDDTPTRSEDSAVRKRADGFRRRELILRSAAQLFAARGFDATGIDDVGRAAGISGSGIYRHFGTKNELLTAVVERAAGRRTERVATIVEQADGPEETLTRLVDDLVQTVLDERSISGALWRELRHLDTTGSGWWDRLHRLNAQEYVRVLLELRPELGESEARVRVDGVYGLAISTAEFDSGLEREALRDVVVDMALRALLR